MWKSLWILYYIFHVEKKQDIWHSLPLNFWMESWSSSTLKPILIICSLYKSSGLCHVQTVINPTVSHWVLPAANLNVNLATEAISITITVQLWLHCCIMGSVLYNGDWLGTRSQVFTFCCFGTKTVLSLYFWICVDYNNYLHICVCVLHWYHDIIVSSAFFKKKIIIIDGEKKERQRFYLRYLLL